MSEISVTREYLEKSIESKHKESHESRKKISDLIQLFEESLKNLSDDVNGKCDAINEKIDNIIGSDFTKFITLEELDSAVSNIKLDMVDTINKAVIKYLEKDNEERWQRLAEVNSLPKKKIKRAK